MVSINLSDWKRLSAIVCILGLIFLGLSACGGSNSSQPPENAADSSAQKSDTQSAEKRTQSRNSSATKPSGWQTVQIGDWNISFPADWNGDPDTDIWQPGEVGTFMGRPALSFFSGGIPVPPPGTFDERVKTRIGGEPQETVKITVSGLSGIKCSWEENGKKHRGIFLEEKIGSVMIVINFFDCQAPVADFGQYQADFEKILASIDK
jgi:hypothetical protein